MKRLIAGLACAVALVAGAQGAASISEGVRTLQADFTGENPPDRLCVDFPIRLDLSRATAVTFDFSCEDLQTFAGFTLYFKSGGGWYSTQFTPRVEGRTEHVRIPVREITGVEGEPAGKDRIDAVRLSGWNGAPNKCVVTFGKLRAVDASDAEALVVCCDSCEVEQERAGCVYYASRTLETIDALGLPVAQVPDRALTGERLKGVRLVVLPYNLGLPPQAAKALADWMAAGGRMLICYTVPDGFHAVAGVRPRMGFYAGGKDGRAELGGFLRSGEGLPFQPRLVRQNSHCCHVVEPLEGARVVAEWADRATGRSLGMPALVKAPQAVYMAHCWDGGASGERLELMRSILASLVPEWDRRFAAEVARNAAHAREVASRVARMPPKAGERRLAWCHSAWGLGGGRDWDASVRFLRENGFTDLIDNLAWGGTAYYGSRVLARAANSEGKGDALEECLAACRRYGIRLHVWKVCWNPGHGMMPGDMRERYVAEGRLQVRGRGDFSEAWLCPSDPRNRDQEIEAMCELADRGVDGVHFDYIRYPGHDCCFCDGCRGRFERKLGRAVANWPADLSGDKALAVQWTEFRCGNISAVVEGVARRLRTKHPKTEISAAVMRNAPLDRVSLGQDWGRWCREGWLDFVCPMDYTESPALFRGHLRRQKDQVANVALYPGIGLSCWSEDGEDATRFADQVEAVREAGLGGFTVFNFDRRAEAVFPLMRKGPFAE